MTMKLDKKKITYAAVIGAVCIFIITYSILVFGGDEPQKDVLQQPQVPLLENTVDTYTSRLDAVDDLKEVKQTNAPSIYDEKYLDSTGVFDPNFLENEKARIVDSIYNNSRINYSEGGYRNTIAIRDSVTTALAAKKEAQQKVDSVVIEKIDPKILALEQQLFFASNPLSRERKENTTSLEVIVDKKQIIKANDRLEMRTLNDVRTEEILIPKNTILYGIVSFKPNRVVLQIENIGGIPLAFTAYDFRDKREGIYVRNTFKEEIQQEVLGEVIEGINVPGVPQITGIKKIFQRSNRQLKILVNRNYKLTLKIDKQR